MNQNPQPEFDDPLSIGALIARVAKLERRLARQPWLDVLDHVRGAFPIEVRRNDAGLQIALAAWDEEAVVELTSTLTQGGSAQAKVLWYTDTWSEAQTRELKVYDVVGTMYGTPGHKALVRFHRQSGRWIVWQMQC